MDPIELKTRTKAFALRIIKLTEAIPHNISGKAMATQIVRRGTAVAANYRATCRSRSKAEFIARIGVVEEEADETALWLELLAESGLVKARRLELLLNEANDLTATMAASRKSALGK
jgi:four helix bundle protein